MSSALIDLARQCCDADEYLDMGYMCANAELCYNSLRPVGDTFWFAIPYLFNTSENIFFYLHIFLLALVGVSAFYLLKKILPVCVFLLALFFLTWPTFFFTLSDTPATLFFIEGIVLALIGLDRKRRMIFFAAGLSLGLSVLLRAAYFYPLIIASVAFVIYWLWQKNRQWPAIFIFSFVIPLSLQFVSTWKHTGQWHFLSEGRSDAMMKLHLNSAAAGYDTYLPQSGAYWAPDCNPRAGLLPSVENADITSTICVLKNRFSFYLGSYAASAFLGIEARNFFDNDHTGKIISATENASEYFVEVKSLLPLPPGTYHYSVILRASKNHTSQATAIRVDNMTIARGKTTTSAALVNKTILNKSITLADSAQQYAVDINNDTTGYIVVHTRSGAAFHMQAAALEPATGTRGYVQPPQLANTMGQNSNSAKNGRIFSNTYLFINCLLIVFAMVAIFKWLAISRSPIIIFIAALLFSVLVQCLVIIPEQRYLQGFLGACWLMVILLTSNHHRHS